jgi:hypothetical protein
VSFVGGVTTTAAALLMVNGEWLKAGIVILVGAALDVIGRVK